MPDIGEAARSLFNEAVRHHPDNANGRVNLANLLLLIGEHAEARVHFEAALAIDAGHIHAHRGMGNLLAEIGDEAGARRHRDKGFKNHFLTTLALPRRGLADCRPAVGLGARRQYSDQLQSSTIAIFKPRSW